MITTPIVPTTVQRQLHQSSHQDHATPDHPDDSCHLVMPGIEVEGPGHAEECELEEDEPDAADDEKLRQASMPAAVKEDAGSGQEDECGRAKMGNPAGEEDPGCLAASRNARINSHVIDGHQYHCRAANQVNRPDPSRRSVAGLQLWRWEEGYSWSAPTISVVSCQSSVVSQDQKQRPRTGVSAPHMQFMC